MNTDLTTDELNEIDGGMEWYCWAGAAATAAIGFGIGGGLGAVIAVAAAGKYFEEEMGC